MATVRRRVSNIRLRIFFRIVFALLLAGFVIIVAIILYRYDTGFRELRNRHRNFAKLSLSNKNQIRKMISHTMNSMVSPTNNKTLADTEQEIIRNKKSIPKNDIVNTIVSDSNHQPMEKTFVTKTYYEIRLGNLVFMDGRTEGTILIEICPDWAPIGAAHVDQLLQEQFYVDCRFFRVVTNFMVQFGIHGDPNKQKQYRTTVLLDDVMGVQSNTRGTISFASSGKNSRSTQLFINTRKNGNAYLDKEGFTPVGRVIEGMEYVDAIFAGAQEKPNQHLIQVRGNDYLNQEFPKLSYIQSITSVDPQTLNHLKQLLESN